MFDTPGFPSANLWAAQDPNVKLRGLINCAPVDEPWSEADARGGQETTQV